MLLGMEEKGVYLVLTVTDDIFDAINDRMLISGSNDNIKYLLGNQAEMEHLAFILNKPVSFIPPTDYFKVIKGKV